MHAGRERSSADSSCSPLPKTQAALAAQGSPLVSSERDPEGTDTLPICKAAQQPPMNPQLGSITTTATCPELLGPTLVSLDHGLAGGARGVPSPLPVSRPWSERLGCRERRLLRNSIPTPEPAPPVPRRESRETGLRSTEQSGVDSVEKREAWRERGSKKRNAPQARPATSLSPARGRRGNGGGGGGREVRDSLEGEDA